MSAATAEPPTVAMSFANNFWGKDDAGVGPLLERMQGAKQTCDELRSFYSARASIEDEYARKLLNLTRKALGSQESGTLKTSLDTVRGEVETMAKQHQSIATQMKSELEEPLAAFAGGMKERRKIVQNTVEKLLKTKIQQTHHVNKTRDKYEQECLKIKGYLAQGHMVMGQEERKNKAKLEKTQITVATSNTEYENAVKILEETTARWNREWKAAADKFQDLEEERLDFTKSSLWTFANIASTVCVSDDASCEKIRLSLEKMEVEKDIINFITTQGTGQEIPDAPKYINFCRGDINDSQSEVSEDENFSVAQFPRSINPAFRSSSPQPSTFESHHDPNSKLAHNLAHREPPPSNSREATLTPQKQPPPVRQSMEDQYQRQPQQQPAATRQSIDDQYHRQLQHQSTPVRQSMEDQYRRQPQKQPAPVRHSIEEQYQRQPQKQPPPMRQTIEDQYQRQQPPPASLGYDVNQHGPVAAVPHDPYPMDGMTMLCRTGPSNPSGPPSDRSSQVTMNRPSSHDENSDYATSLSSMEPPSGKTSPIKQEPSAPAPAPASPVTPAASPEKRVFKKKSGFFQNHSPFRRKSVKEVQAPAQTNRNTWHVPSAPASASPTRQQLRLTEQHQQPRNLLPDRSHSPEPIDANASVALGIGQNVLPVTAIQDKKKGDSQPAKQEVDETDPIAMALAELKGVTLDKQSSLRMSADHYHGIATPAPRSNSSMSQSVPAPGGREAAAVKRGTPPPSYQSPSRQPTQQSTQQAPVSRLGVPPPAVTSKAMKEATKKATTQTRSMFSDSPRTEPRTYSSSTQSRPGTRGTDIPRAASPAPTRSASPQPQRSMNNRQADYRSASPNPYQASPRRDSFSPAPPRASFDQGYHGRSSPHGSVRGSVYGGSVHGGSVHGSVRGASPTPYREQQRPQSSYGGSDMAVQLAPVGDDPYGSQRGRDSGRPESRAMGLYNGDTRQRSKSVADPSRLYTRDGRPILHYAIALYMYQAAIPEELGFSKGDYLAVLRHQDDGWWEAEVHNGNGRIGLVPSNYLEPC